MSRLIRNAGRPVLLLDSGALLFRQPVLPTQVLAAARLKAEGIVRAYARMEYAAVGVAPQDLAGGLDFLRRQNNTLPWISLNLVTDQGRPVFPARILTRAGDLRIAVLGLTGPVRRTNVRQNGYRVTDWRQSLPPALKEAREEADMVILLSSYPFQVNEEIARSQKGIALILQAGVSESTMTPRLVADTLVCQTAGRGKYLGVLDITWTGGNGWSMTNEARRALLRQRLNRIDLQLRRMKERASSKNRQDDTGFRQLLATRTGIEGELRRLAEEKEGQHPNSTYSNRFIAIKTSLPQDRQVETLVRQTLRRVNELGRKRIDQRRKERQQEDRIRKRLGMLTGSRTCSACHQSQAAFWRRTRHATAWQTLVAAGRQFDQACQPCHVTLPAGVLAEAGMQGLPPLIPADLRGVGCESCHGSGRRHADNPARNRIRKPDAATCASCHRSDHDPGFSLAARLPLVRCPGTNMGR